MRMLPGLLLLAAALGAGPGAAAPERPAAPAAVIPLRNGVNRVDILGDGHPAIVFVAWRENYNAHGYSTATFYVREAVADRDSAADSTWLLVPFSGGPRDGNDYYRTFEGADCTLNDIRLLQPPGRPFQVVIADRAFGKTFVDTEAVRFDFYDLSRNEEGIVGWPPYYFQHTRTVKAKRPYCDVDDAFDQELGLGHRGLGNSR